MVLIGIGANLPSPGYGPPRATCGAALSLLERGELSISARSPWYKSAPVPVSDQPWFVNGVVRVETALDPQALMGLLLQTEEAIGRQRGERNAARILDLDLLAHGDLVWPRDIGGGGGVDGDEPGRGSVTVPHPRMHDRAFVLLPLRDVAPGWRHPVSGETVESLIRALPKGQQTEPIVDADGVFGTEWREADRPKPINKR